MGWEAKKQPQGTVSQPPCGFNLFLVENVKKPRADTLEMFSRGQI
jgi:hypothetical protein